MEVEHSKDLGKGHSVEIGKATWDTTHHSS